MKYILGSFVLLAIALGFISYHSLTSLSPLEKMYACIALKKNSQTNIHFKQIWDQQCQHNSNENDLLILALKDQNIPSNLVSEKDINFLFEENQIQIDDILNENRLSADVSE